MELDEKERSILTVLQEDGRISNVDLAERVGSSESPCYRRVRALEEAGIVSGYTALLDRRRLGLQVTAFVLVTAETQDARKLKGFYAAIDAEPCIIECHAMSGSHDFLLKTVARNMDHFSDLVMERILKIPGVKSVESNFSLRAIKENSPVPIP